MFPPTTKPNPFNALAGASKKKAKHGKPMAKPATHKGFMPFKGAMPVMPMKNDNDGDEMK